MAHNFPINYLEPTVCKVEKSSHLNKYNFVNMSDMSKIHNNNQKDLSVCFWYE